MLALLFQISIFNLLYNIIYPLYDIILWEVVLATCCITLPERYITDKDLFYV